MRLPRMTTRRWMLTVAAASLPLALVGEALRQGVSPWEVVVLTFWASPAWLSILYAALGPATARRFAQGACALALLALVCVVAIAIVVGRLNVIHPHDFPLIVLGAFWLIASSWTGYIVSLLVNGGSAGTRRR
jgi:hypothetical protein